MTGRRRGRGRSPYQRFGNRAVFAGALLGFLILGIVLVGDFSAQWWLLMLPVALLVAPVAGLLRGRDPYPDEGQDADHWA